MTFNPVRPADLFKEYRGLPHQLAAISELEDALNAAAPALLSKEQAWFKTWSTVGKQTDLAPAIQLIKEFEGCRLSAYPDPLSGAEPWTIGYGTTRYSAGTPVKRGDKINVIEADMLLRLEVDRIAQQLRAIPNWNAMSDAQRSALVSFAYNLGDFYGHTDFETISAALRDKNWAAVPAAMLLYRNPGTPVEAGLARRRRAEGELWLSGMVPQLQQDKVQDSKPQQSKPQEQQPQQGILLRVPYEAQNDNSSGTGYRECFSSSAAMVARFYGKVSSDDAYNKIRAKFGDTTDSQAQVKALQSLGLEARLRTNCNAAVLEAELRAGRPVMVGWLHKGPITAPTGGGHWSVVIGCTSAAFIHNDPNGEADLINGGYVNHSKGAGIAYSRKNWLRRWEADGANTGWALLVSPKS
jgi:GH24 family phage-related lysozyme (muramidase)